MNETTIAIPSIASMTSVTLPSKPSNGLYFSGNKDWSEFRCLSQDSISSDLFTLGIYVILSRKGRVESRSVIAEELLNPNCGAVPLKIRATYATEMHELPNCGSTLDAIRPFETSSLKRRFTLLCIGRLDRRRIDGIVTSANCSARVPNFHHAAQTSLSSSFRASSRFAIDMSEIGTNVRRTIQVLFMGKTSRA